MPKIFISNQSFGEANPQALALLREHGEVDRNAFNRRLTEEEIIARVTDADVVIAGTEPISAAVIEAGRHLKLIARVGVGLDAVDLQAAEMRGICVSYTPDPPASAVAELTIGLMLSLLRNIHINNQELHEGHWRRRWGRDLNACRVGVVGVGRVGRRVIELLQAAFSGVRVLACDPHPCQMDGVRWVNLEVLLAESDVVSLHVLLEEGTRHLIGSEALSIMRKGSFLVNTSRGGVVDEAALYHSLKSDHLAGVALDVFKKEPYSGPLKELPNCILTSHIGGMTCETRAIMEQQVVEDVIAFLKGDPLQYPVLGKMSYDLASHIS